MATSSIYELLPAFKERNSVIFMLLGLLSLSQDWMQMLETQANARQRGGEIRISSPAQEDSADETAAGLLYFLLGTISFSRHLHSTLEKTRLDGLSSLPEARPDLSWEDVSELLR